MPVGFMPRLFQCLTDLTFEAGAKHTILKQINYDPYLHGIFR